METTADKIRALAFAIGVHLLCVLVALVGLLWTRKEAPISVMGSPMEAIMIDLSVPAAAPPAATRPAPQPPAAPPPQPRPEPRPQRAEDEPQPQPQPQLPVPDTRDAEREAALALQRDEERRRREEQERRRQEQVLLEEQQRQREAERRERQRQQELKREQELAEIRRQREAAERQRRLEADRLAQLADQRAQATPQQPSRETAPQPTQPLGNNGTDDSLRGRYMLAIQQAVTQAWLRPEHVTAVQCRVRIIQIPGGEVMSASILSPCAADELTRRSMEAAVLKAQPLPYRGFESVFAREITFTFCYPRDRC